MHNLFGDNIDFNDVFFQEQLITYLGNKRSLLPFLNRGIETVKKQLNKDKLKAMDGFAGVVLCPDC